MPSPTRAALYHRVSTVDHQSFNCAATVIYPDAVAGGKRSAPLDPRLDLWNHSPSGVGYGYAGSGPAQLALGILADFLGPGREDLAVKLHQSLKFERIATAINAEPLVIPGEDISAWLRDSDAGKRARCVVRRVPERGSLVRNMTAKQEIGLAAPVASAGIVLSAEAPEDPVGQQRRHEQECRCRGCGAGTTVRGSPAPRTGPASSATADRPPALGRPGSAAGRQRHRSAPRKASLARGDAGEGPRPREFHGPS